MMKACVLHFAALALGVAIGSMASSVEAATPIFLDSFESGDLCAWQGTCLPPTEVEGTWIGDLVFPGGVVRPVAVRLHQRADGELLGYLLGTSESWVVRSGAYTGGVLDLELVLGRLSEDRIVTLAGPVEGGRATLSLTGDLPNQTAELVRWPEELVERRLVVADSTDGLSPPHFVSLAVALDAEGRLVAGSWSGTQETPPWGQDGGVTSFTTVGETVSIGLDLDGGCSAGSTLNATFDPAVGLYLGSFNLIDCAGPQSGTWLGGFIDGTTSGDVAEILSTLATVADQLESNVPFTSPHPSFANDSVSYTHLRAHET